jgi:hypothetical protein
MIRREVTTRRRMSGALPIAVAVAFVLTWCTDSALHWRDDGSWAASWAGLIRAIVIRP